jgi:hypothetical protein
MARKAALCLIALGLALASCENSLISSLGARSLLEYRTDGNENPEGRPPAEPKRYPKGSLVELLGNEGGLSRQGARFGGWALLPNSASPSHKPGERVEMGGTDLVLYPVWLSTTGLSVTYDPNGATSGQAPVDSARYNEGASVRVMGNSGNLAKIGSSFIGWSLSAEGEAPVYNEGSSVAMPAGGLRFYARWRSEGSQAYVLRYDGNGASGGPPAAPALYPPGQYVIIADNYGGFEYPYLSFAGWNSKPDGSGYSYVPMNQVMMPIGNLTLYAQWRHTIKFDPNGADWGVVPYPLFFKPGDTVQLPPTGGLGRGLHHFIGWSEDPMASYALFPNEAYFSPDAKNYYLYAVWERDSYVVSYSLNGGAAGALPPPESYQWGSTIVLPPADSLVGTYPEVYFSHFSTLSSGPGGENRLPGETFIMPQQDLTIYARWARPGQRVAGFTSLAGGVINDIVELDDGDIMIAGNFTQYGSLNTRRHLVRLNADLSVDTDYNFNYSGFGFDGEVKSIAFSSDGYLYVVGNFSKYNNDSKYRFAGLDAKTGQLLSKNLNVTVEASDAFNSISFADPFLGFVIGGAFSISDGSSTANNIARFSSSGILQGAFNPSVSLEVLSLEANASVVVYLCKSVNEVRRLRVDDGNDLGQHFNLNAFMYKAGTFAQDGTGLLVGGDFTIAAGVPRGRLARMANATNLDMDFISDPGANGEVRAIYVPSSGNSILIGGAFTTYDDKPSAFLARVYRSMP